MLSIGQNMADDIESYESEENQLRVQLPGVFTVGDFKTEDAAQMLVI
ncbi:MAG: hypothetical protein ACK55I_01250 [bacterium]